LLTLGFFWDMVLLWNNNNLGIIMIEKFRKKMKKDGRSFRWFWQNNLYTKLTYPYFIIQLNDPDRLQDVVKESIQKYLDVK